MLVLSRKANETIVIEGNIRITVVGIRGNQVRLGIEAPDRVAIYREELCLPDRTAEPGAEPFATESPLRGNRSRAGLAENKGILKGNHSLPQALRFSQQPENEHR